jgi:outer membrane protein TolC
LAAAGYGFGRPDTLFSAIEWPGKHRHCYHCKKWVYHYVRTQVSQAIFSPSLIYAYRSAPLYTKQSQQATDSTKIFLVSSVSKSFYNVLLTLEQINVLKEDTARLGKNLRDAYHQYKGGIVDETDYEEAEITLNNSVAQLKQATQNVVPQYAGLKRLIGYPADQQFNVSFDGRHPSGYRTATRVRETH